MPPASGQGRARETRKWPTVVVGVAAIVAVFVVTGTALSPVVGRSVPVVRESAAPVVDVVPAMPGLRPHRALPPSGLTVREPRPLSQRPVLRAVAVVEPAGAEGATRPEPLFVLDTDGSWARIDVVEPTFTRDFGGNQAHPLRTTAISPDRRLVAVAQSGEVLVIDVTTARVHRVPLAGFNEQVLWRSDDILLVTHDADEWSTATYAVDWRAGTATRVVAGLSVWNAVVPDGDGPLLELRGLVGAESGNGPVTVAEWELDREAPVRRVPVDFGALGHHAVNEWYGPALREGDLVVRAGWGRSPILDGGAEMVAVVDVRTGAVRRLLDLGRDRSKSCCQPLDWVDGHTVLLRTDREGLLAWDVRTGAVNRVVDGPLDGTVALALE